MSEMHTFTPATRFENTPNVEMRFPPMPRTVAEVSHLLSEQSDVPDTPRLVEIVNQDPVMAASVLRRINSAYYGMRRRIGDIRKGVFLLGFLEVCNIVMTAAMIQLRDVLQTAEQEHIFDSIMDISTGAAHYAQEVAILVNLPHKSLAFSAGLLHSVGRLVLLYNKPDDYEALWYTSPDGLPPNDEDEQTIFGTDHAKLGALAANQWQLPEEIEEAIRYYQTPARASNAAAQDLARAVQVGAEAVRQLDLEGGPQRTFRAPRSLFELAQGRDANPRELVDLVEQNAPAPFAEDDSDEA